MGKKANDFGYSVGSTYRDFKVTKVFEIHELQALLVELVHQPTGAQVLQIVNEDPENLFCLSFKTLPDSSNGVAHILEHTVLCGSEKFPVKDPFFAMNRRSLNTFMNALTGSDFTCYPASSQVPKDFYNLLEVYIDAVFNPLLNELSFLQEGCRLEFSNATDPKSPLDYKGIVFNEMKGVMASPTSRLNEAINEALFPDLTYGINSGGDPSVIPTLTYEQLKDFHKKYYHPSRCLFFFYGNLPLERHLDFITEHVLKDTEPQPQLPPLPLQKRFKQPVYKDVFYPISSDEDPNDKTLIGFSWLTCHILDQEQLLALNVIEIALMDTDASPLKMALLKSGLCKQAYAYVEGEMSEVPFTIVLKGCNPESAAGIEVLIKKSFDMIAHKGIPKQLIENAIHQLEFYRSEITGDSAPFGLSLFMRSALLKQHGGYPEDGLMIHGLFNQLRKKIEENPHYLQDLIQKHFIDNTHTVRVVLRPDQELAARELAEEKARVEKIESLLTEDQKLALVEKSKELLSFQEMQSNDDADVLPKVELEDVPKKARVYPLTRETCGNLEVFHHACFTNEIVYADLVFPLPHIEQEDLPYVRLFTNLLTQVGCNGRNYVENLDYIQGNTGGIGAMLSLNLQCEDCLVFKPSLHIKGKALYRKADKLFSLFAEISKTPHFDDVPRLKEIVLKHYTGLQSGINHNALKYAINLSASALNESAMVANDWYGLRYFWKIREIAHDFDAHSDMLVKKLEELQKQLLALKGAHLIITSDEELYKDLVQKEFYGLQNMELSSFSPWRGGYPVQKIAPQGRIISSPVAFTSKVFKTVSYTHPDAPALNIAAYIFDNLVLHTRLREQGGAYGGGAASNAMSGNFYFYSYRDPNISATFKAFDEAVETLVNGQFDADDLEEAKFEMIQALDSPVAPGSRGDIAYGWWREGRTQEIRQAYRERLLALTVKDIQEAVKRQIVPNIDKGTPVVFAGKDLLEKENALLETLGQKPLKIEAI